jgi:hypothetical protein
MEFLEIIDIINPKKKNVLEDAAMNPLLKEITRNPLLWLLAFVPLVFVADQLVPARACWVETGVGRRSNSGY